MVLQKNVTAGNVSPATKLAAEEATRFVNSKVSDQSTRLTDVPLYLNHVAAGVPSFIIEVILSSGLKAMNVKGKL
eukprot:3652280-Amphidinium_carterae.1